MIPTQINSLIFRNAVGEIRESERAVRFACVFTAEKDRAEFVKLLENIPDYLEQVTLFSTDTDEQYAVDLTPNVGEEFRVDIKKKVYEKELRLFSKGAIRQNQSLLGDFRCVRIAEFEEDDQFSTEYTVFTVWLDDERFSSKELEDRPDPRRFCVDFARPPEVPTDIRPWIVIEGPNKGGRIPSEWVEIASRRLMASLADRVSKIEDEVEYHFDGPPSCKFSLTDEQIVTIFPRLTEGAKFVYLNEPRDADARHLLLSSEWARSYRKSSLDDLGENCTKSAGLAYSAYIKAKSAEMLAALSSLRKSVMEETKEISDKGHDFARSMWKDLAVAAAPFVVKVLSDAAQTDSSEIAKFLSFFAAGFLVFSLAFQWFLSERWLRSQDKARGIWRLEVNTALSAEEMRKIADDPISRSIFDYRLVGALVTLFYCVIVYVLIQYGRGLIGL